MRTMFGIFKKAIGDKKNINRASQQQFNETECSANKLVLSLPVILRQKKIKGISLIVAIVNLILTGTCIGYAKSSDERCFKRWV